MDKMTLVQVKKYLKIDENVEFAKVDMTPQQAKSLLKRCSKVNRPINNSHVETLRRDMEAGNWYNDVDCIGFDENGSIINGQHRLKALSVAYVDNVTFNIHFGVSQHVAMDSGRNRSNNDNITIFKKSNGSLLGNPMPNSFKTIITSAIKLKDTKVKLSTNEYYTIWNKYEKDFTKCEKSGLFDLGNKANSSSVKASIFLAYLSGVDIKVLKNIAEVLNTGITAKKEDIPIARFRDHLIDLKLSKNVKDIEIVRAKYCQIMIHNVVEGSTSNRLPSNPQLLYDVDLF